MFVVIVLGASWLHDSTSLISRSMIAASPLVSVPMPIVTVPPEVTAVGTTGDREPVREPDIPALIVEPANASISTPMPPPDAALADDNLLVTQALQRYRTAYEGLDAYSAQAVWPAVNQAALARAFDGLESQSLTFDACDVRVRGESATATCQGSARSVPKIGSREPRIEPLVWNFSLHKAGGDWKIESARAER